MPLCYQYTGALTADILTQNNIIFKNTLELTATNNSLLVSKSTTIDPAIKEKLKNIQGILYLSRVAGKYSNIHLMTSRATTLDGIERIGYIRGQKDAIQFTEYPRGKNVHYSAFYPYVKNLLQNNGF